VSCISVDLSYARRPVGPAGAATPARSAVQGIHPHRAARHRGAVRSRASRSTPNAAGTAVSRCCPVSGPSSGLNHEALALLVAGSRWPSGKSSTSTLWGRLTGMHLADRAEFSTFRRTFAAEPAAEPATEPPPSPPPRYPRRPGRSALTD
jgi:hypothetical protein